ncbi:GNAT family N-acetyltransferase, partial [Fusobacterium ulcerans]
MNILKLETDRFILRNFEKKDIEALYFLLKDTEVNTFLPWFPVKTLEEAKIFFEKRLKNQ